jgi:hypothetical protein
MKWRKQMRKIRIHSWMLVLGALGILSMAGCHVSLPDAAEAGMFDFLAGTITDTLTQLIPLADMAANGG